MAILSPWLDQKFYLADGVTPNAGGKVFTYEPGTTTKKASYVSESGAANANPIILNAAGECNLWLSGAYKIVNAPSTDTDPPAAAIKTWDDVNIDNAAGAGVGIVDSIAQLKGLDEGAFETVQVLGYYSANGIGGGLYYWNSSSTTSDNQGTIIAPTVTDGTGRWILQESEVTRVSQFGARGSSSAEDVAAINAASTYANANGRTLVIDSPVLMNSNVTIAAYIQAEASGRFTSGSASTLTLNGGADIGRFKFFYGDVVVVFGTKDPKNIFPEWWGIAADDSTNDAATINTAITRASARGGGDVVLGPYTYFVGSTPIAMASNVRLIGSGSGKTTLRATDAGAFGALNYTISFGSVVTNAEIQGMTLSCATMVSGGTTGIYIAGTYITIRDVEVSNLKIGILGKSTSRYVEIVDYKQISTTGMASFGIHPSGVQDWTLDRINMVGTSPTIGIDKPLGFQNGGTAYGCQRVKVTNYRSNYTVSYGLGGNPDDFYPDITATYPNPNQVWTMFFKAATGVIAGDIGKTIVQGATTIGVLLAYDDTVIPARWVFSRTSDPAADTATTITTGTGAGTTIINNHRKKANTTTDNQWTGIDCNYASDASIGHGISMDACFSTHLSNWSAFGNSEAGVYIGDSLCEGSSVSNGTASYNDWGIVNAASAITEIVGNDLNHNDLAGIFFAPIASGLSNVINYTLIANNNIWRNGRSHTQSTDSGVGGDPSYCVFKGNAIFENVRHNIGLTGGSNCLWQGNQIFDSGWTGGALSPRDCIYMEDGNAHIFEGNIIGARLSPSTVTRGFNLLTNANDNIIRNNTIVGWTTAAITDAGTRNQDLDNWKDTTATSILNGTGLTARTTGAAMNYPSATTNTTANPALTLDNNTTNAGITPTLRVYGNVNTGVSNEPFNRAGDFLNRNADFSSELVRIENDGVAGAINSVNGSLLGLSGTLGAPLYRLSSVATNDDPEEKMIQGREATTDATQTTLLSIALAASQTRAIEAIVIARRTGGAAGTAEDGARYKLSAVYKNVGGAATIIGAATISADEDQAGWDCIFDVTGSSVRIRVTGAVNNDITWHATVRTYRVGS